MKAFLSSVAAFAIGMLVIPGPRDPEVIQPIEFNHKAHVKRNHCRECHFVMPHNRDEDGDIDCEECDESELPLCEEHAVLSKHKLPGIPQTEMCIRCHEDDILELTEAIADGEVDPDLARKRILLDYVGVNEDEEVIARREIPWKRITTLPTSNIYFSHRTHVLVARIDCKICHGDVAEWEKPPTRPLVTLNMDACIDCHQRENATTQCVSCHR